MKTYTTIIEKVNGEEGVINFVKYLQNEKHKNHKNTKIELLNNDYIKFAHHVILEEQSLEIKKRMAKKGGRPSSEYCKSFTFNIPPIYKDLITKSKLQSLNTQIIKNIATYLKIDYEEIERKSLSVLHRQENTHIHFVLATVLKNKKNREIKSKAFLNFVKTIFTQQVDQILETSIKKYETTTTKPKVYKQMDPKQLEKLESELDNLKTLLQAQKALKNLSNEDKAYLESIEVDLSKEHTIKATTKLNKFIQKHT